MFEDRTVFVVGAGASAEFGLPVGWKLLEQIRDNSRFRFGHGSRPERGNSKIFDTLINRYSGNGEELEAAFRTLNAIHDGVETAGSIDEYINRYSHDGLIAELGKIQIAYSILQAEARSKLTPSKGKEAEGVDWSAVQDTWISPFTRALFEGVRATDVENLGSNITIICFNYDRCLEHYLEYAIMRGYRDVDRKTARKIVESINIIHPYGSLGSLSSMSFGRPVGDADLFHITKNLITWSETVADTDLLVSIKDAIRQSLNIVFLGFAFANQNMKLLDAELVETKPHFTRVYATGYGLTDDIELKLKRNITGLISPLKNYREQFEFIQIKYGMTCKEFMDKQMLNFVV